MSLNHSALKQQASHGLKGLGGKGVSQSRMISTKQTTTTANNTGTGVPGKLPQVKGAISPLERRDKDLLISAGLGAIHARAPQGINGAIGQGLAPERSLERN